ncbi:MAG: hypothetical protein ABJK39_01710 [Hyphomicrobiales bacterium]
MANRAKIRLSVKQGLIFGSAFLLASSVLVPSPSFSQVDSGVVDIIVEPEVESKEGFFGRVFKGGDRKRRKAARKAAKAAAKRREEAAANAGSVDVSGASRTELIQDLKEAKQELQKREFDIENELAAAKQELARRQSTGQITPEQVKQTPANIRDKQLSELEKLKAELARRQLTNTTKAERIGRALTDNELAYRYVDQCITRPSGDFRNLFNGQADLELIVAEKKDQVYRNSARTVLVQTSDQACDVSFNGGDVGDYTAGLVHILETQGGLVETKRLAGLTIINTVHPRGNFRLATGKKVIGSSDTNLYTSIIALR